MSLKTALMEITKRSPLPYNSLVAPTGASGKGVAYMEDPATAGNAILADGTKPAAGFVTRPIVSGGQTLGDLVYPNRLELPFQDSDPYMSGVNMLSLEQAQEVVAEGYDPLHVNGNLYSGTGGNAGKSILPGTAVKTKCSFFNGQFCVGVTGQYCEWIIEEIGIAPMIAGNLRVRFSKLPGGVQL